ncbi:MAG: oligoendopeptidase F [Simkaniaceae bacterium]|nr:oligoendopeptidase F [Simkaniaceae bacterium]
MAKERSEVPMKDTWDVEMMYPNLDAWNSDFEKIFTISKNKWEELLHFRGKLDEGEDIINELLTKNFSLQREIEKLYTYAHLKHDEDVAHERHKEAYQKATALYYDYANAASWIEPELLQLEEVKLKGYVDSQRLESYSWFLKMLLDQKDHILSLEEEGLMSLAGQALSTPSKTFGAFNNADLKFLPARDSVGGENELTHGSYSLYLKSKDRELRKSAYENIHLGFANWENTVTEMVHGSVQSHLFNARARKFSSCLEAALYPNQIDPKVYRNLIAATKERIGSLHNYISFRKKALGVDELHTYDLYTPLSAFDKTYPYHEACQIVIDSYAPLGHEYQNSVREGLLKERWVDVYENERKRSGGYSSGCYDSVPYILLNYHDVFNDMMTLSHEVGHSMHSKTSNSHQPFHYASYPIFVAEVASTFNEALTYRHLLERADNEEERYFIINQQVDGIRATFFRQTLFAEFELLLHEFAEKSIPITPGLMRDEYTRLCAEYYGPDLTIDEQLGYECLRIPHFYYNFYVYQYATGIAAAQSLVNRVLNEGDQALADYHQFLASGKSDYPVNLLRKAGVDMTTQKPIYDLIDRFDELVKSLEKN